MEVILWAHALSTIMLAGLIWFVQIVHYPLFALVGAASFATYEREHQARTSLVVGPLMLTEAITAGVILFAGVGEMWLGVTGFALVLVIWGSTAFIQVPLHRRLELGLNGQVVRLLVFTNLIRTAAWSIRACLALMML